MAPIIKVKGLRELGKALAGGDKFLRNAGSQQEPRGVTSQKRAFFIFKSVKTSNLLIGVAGV
jgi:hypothetical protein